VKDERSKFVVEKNTNPIQYDKTFMYYRRKCRTKKLLYSSTALEFFRLHISCLSGVKSAILSIAQESEIFRITHIYFSHRTYLTISPIIPGPSKSRHRTGAKHPPSIHISLLKAYSGNFQKLPALQAPHHRPRRQCPSSLTSRSRSRSHPSTAL
jgi:hypothetical protein